MIATQSVANSPDAKLGGDPLAELRGVSKHYGAVLALNDVDFAVRPARMVGIVGHNGAGKSTLIRVLAGLIRPTAGTVFFAGRELTDGFDTRQAYAYGIRCVFQELSLCETLTVYENVRVLHPRLAGRGWRALSRKIIRQALDTIFPGHDIDPDQTVGGLSLGRRQMVEIARAFTVVDVPVRLVILDEPTSSLDAKVADRLMAFTRAARSGGIACVFISHRLREVVSYSDDIVVMRDGAVTEATVVGPEISEDAIVEKMGSVTSAIAPRSLDELQKRGARELRVRASRSRGQEILFHLDAGEVVGLSGLAGQGQREVLLDVLSAARARNADMQVNGTVVYVTGDRQGEGVFPLWSLLENLSAGSLDRLARFGVISLRRELELAETWRRRLAIRTASVFQPIRALSGGNQQKVLIARAFAAEPDIVLFNDPTRGVDIGTRRESMSGSASGPPPAARSFGIRPRQRSSPTATVSTFFAKGTSWTRLRGVT